MKLVYEVTTKDDKIKKYDCVDFCSFGGEFITMFQKDFKREHIRTDTVLHVKQVFKK